MDHGASVLIIDPITLFREGLRRILVEAGYQIVWCSDCLPGAPVSELSGQTSPLLIIGSEIDEAIVQITNVKRLYPSSRLILLLDATPPHQVVTAFRLGADTVILRSATCEALIDTLKLVLSGSTVVPSVVLEALLRPQEAILLADPCKALCGDNAEGGSNWLRQALRLSARELSVVPRLRNGLSNKEIARELGIAEATVKVHVKALLRKAGVRNRTQLVMWAIENGLEHSPRIAI